MNHFMFLLISWSQQDSFFRTFGEISSFYSAEFEKQWSGVLRCLTLFDLILTDRSVQGVYVAVKGKLSLTQSFKACLPTLTHKNTHNSNLTMTQRWC